MILVLLLTSRPSPQMKLLILLARSSQFNKNMIAEHVGIKYHMLKRIFRTSPLNIKQLPNFMISQHEMPCHFFLRCISHVLTFDFFQSAVARKSRVDLTYLVQWCGQLSCTNNSACVDKAEQWVVMWSRQRGKYQLVLQKKCWSHLLYRTRKAQKWRKHSFGYISIPSQWIGNLKMPSDILVLDHLTFFKII